jgi:hypothetical protein
MELYDAVYEPEPESKAPPPLPRKKKASKQKCMICEGEFENLVEHHAENHSDVRIYGPDSGEAPMPERDPEPAAADALCWRTRHPKSLRRITLRKTEKRASRTGKEKIKCCFKVTFLNQ